MATVDDLIATICPSLDINVNKDIYVEIATSSLNELYFGTQYNYAIALKAAHVFTIDNDPARTNGMAGLVTGRQEGRNSMRYWNSVSDGSASDLNMTHYGQRLKALMKVCRGGALIGNPEVEM